MMKTVCMIIPYFGKLPNYFNLWLESVKYNKDFDFYLITDDRTKYEYPQNVRLSYATFEQLKNRIQGLYDFKINLKNPYKLCDFRPAYGEIFEEEIKDYDFWGYCDIDLIFGDIKKFVTNDILEQFDKINLHGHFSLYKNNEECRKLYRKKWKDLIEYDYVFKRDWSYHFDEYPGIAYYCEYEGVKTIDIENYADIGWLTNKFVKKYDRSKRIDDQENIKQIFYWNKGSLINLIKEDYGIVKEEYMYIHLQKRKMKNSVKDTKVAYFIVPNEFIQGEYEEVVGRIEEYCIDSECEQKNIFKRECIANRFKLEYWRKKIKFLNKRWK